MPKPLPLTGMAGPTIQHQLDEWYGEGSMVTAAVIAIQVVDKDGQIHHCGFRDDDSTIATSVGLAHILERSLDDCWHEGDEDEET